LPTSFLLPSPLFSFCLQHPRRNAARGERVKVQSAEGVDDATWGHLAPFFDSPPRQRQAQTRGTVCAGNVNLRRALAGGDRRDAEA
jgi:hypothetical protein